MNAMRDRIQAIKDAMNFRTQMEMAHYLGTSQATISKWLKGEQEPAGKQRDRINQLYDQMFGMNLPDKAVFAKLQELPPPLRRIALAVLNNVVDELMTLVNRQSKG